MSEADSRPRKVVVESVPCGTDEFPRPRIVANFALTLDGKVSTKNRTPSDFTSPADKYRLLEIRSLGDALLVGRATVEADTMSMGLPDAELRARRVQRGQAEYPLRVVLSESAKFQPGWKIFHSPGGDVVLFVATEKRTPELEEISRFPKVQLVQIGQFSLPLILRVLHQDFGVNTIVCEGGPTLLRSLFALDAVDELYLTFAPRIFGGDAAPTLTGCFAEFLPTPLRFALRDFEVKDGEVFAKFSRDRS